MGREMAVLSVWGSLADIRGGGGGPTGKEGNKYLEPVDGGEGVVEAGEDHQAAEDEGGEVEEDRGEGLEEEGFGGHFCA